MIIGSISYYTSWKIARDKIIDSVVLSTNQLTESVNNRFKQMENVADSVQYSLYTLYNTPQEPFAQYIDTFSSIRQDISSLNTTFDFFQTCAFVKADSFVSGEGLMFYKLEQLRDFQIDEDELMDIGISSKWLFRQNLQFPQLLSPNEKYVDAVLCSQSLKNNEKKSLEYAFFICIRAQDLCNLLQSFYSDGNIRSYIIEEEGTIIAHTDQAKVGTILDAHQLDPIYHSLSSKQVITYQREEYVATPLNNGWSLITVIPESYIKQNINILINIIMIAMILIFPIMVTATIFLSANLTKKLKILTNAVAAAEIKNNNITVKPLKDLLHTKPPYYDEIDVLANTFEHMVKTIDTSFHNILALSIQEEKLKYQLLQSQINPHFLYNILGSVQTCQSLGKLETANQMITALSRFYRMTLRKEGDLITIRDELEIACLYMEMEQLCRSGLFTWDIHKDQGIEDFKICKFTLQPFIENAILHGMRGMEKSMHINIAITYSEDSIVIIITDNGAGIPADTLNEIRLALEKKTVNPALHYGISNVNSRIASELSGFGTIQIDSVIGRGTTITIEFQQIL